MAVYESEKSPYHCTPGYNDECPDITYWRNRLQDVNKFIVMKNVLSAPINTAPETLLSPIQSGRNLNMKQKFRGHSDVDFNINIDFEDVDQPEDEWHITAAQTPYEDMVYIRRRLIYSEDWYRFPQPLLQVFQAPNKLFGTVVQELYMGCKVFSLRGPKGKELLRVEQVFPRSLIHKIFTIWNVPIGQISLDHYVDKEDDLGYKAFSVNFDFVPLDGEQKILLLATTCLINCMCEEGFYWAYKQKEMDIVKL